jgi:CelD/BcsL family acetyltransferase involved in cellulose biosynthesis
MGPLIKDRGQCVIFLKNKSPSDKLAGWSPSPALTFEHVVTRAAFEALEHEWRGLHGSHGLPHQIFLDYNWMWHWCNVFLWQAKRPPAKLSILVGRRHGHVVFIMPLVTVRQFGLKVLSWMGHPVTQYGDILCQAESLSVQDWDAAFHYLVQQSGVDLMYLRKVRADARAHVLVSGHDAVVVDAADAPYIPIDSHLDRAQFEAVFSTKDRKNRRRHRKRLAELGEIKFRAFGRCSTAAEAAGRAIVQKRQWLSDRQLLSSAVSAPEFEIFFRAVLSDQDRPTHADLSMLTVDDKPAAITIGIRTDDYFAAHVTSYDPALETYSPGSLLLEDNLRRLHEIGVRTHDFMTPAFKYKLDWTDKTIKTADYAIALSNRGKLYQSYYLCMMRPQLRRWIESTSSPRKAAILKVLQLCRLSG